ncbi:MAG: M81 family metallopeptidase [Ilumatobacteraceae bacterium]
MVLRVLPQLGDDTARFDPTDRIGVLMFQHECNSFAPGATERSAFTVFDGDEAAERLAAANTEYGGALTAIERLGGRPVPLMAAYALPSGPLSARARVELADLVLESLRSNGTLGGLVVALHGACSAVDEPLADAALLGRIRELVGETMPIAVTLDLHGNPTLELLRHATVLTGYRTNPHVDQAATGSRAVTLLARVLGRDGGRALHPVIHVARCPAVFPDESLRLPGGRLAEIVESVVGDGDEWRGVVDASIFPTQPWLDAPGVGFKAVAVGDEHDEKSLVAAQRLVDRLTAMVWERRGELVVVGTTPPATAIDRAVAGARAAGVRPAIVTESADAPTAGAAGDGTAVLAELLARSDPPESAVTVRDPQVVAAVHAVGRGDRYRGPLGSRIDGRWMPPADVDALVIRVGGGSYHLSGAGHSGMTVTMGRYAVLEVGAVRILVTELAAWSADPATWLHAGIDPQSVELLVVKSCSDYEANFPQSTQFAVVADVAGAATPNLATLQFVRCVPPPYPAGGSSTAR